MPSSPQLADWGVKISVAGISIAFRPGAGKGEAYRHILPVGARTSRKGTGALEEGSAVTFWLKCADAKGSFQYVSSGCV